MTTPTGPLPSHDGDATAAFSCLRSLGWSISEEGQQWLMSVDDIDGHADAGNITRQNGLWNALRAPALLNRDLRKFGAKVFDDSWGTAENRVVAGPLVVQLVSISNVAAPSVQQAGGGERLLMLRLTDGHSKLVGVEFGRIAALSINTPPGTKLRLSGVQIRRGKLLLTSFNTEVLGGHVSSLVESWKQQREIAQRRKLDQAVQLSAAAASHGSEGLATAIPPALQPAAPADAGAAPPSAGPPPFVPFTVADKLAPAASASSVSVEPEPIPAKGKGRCPGNEAAGNAVGNRRPERGGGQKQRKGSSHKGALGTPGPAFVGSSTVDNLQRSIENISLDRSASEATVAPDRDSVPPPLVSAGLTLGLDSSLVVVPSSITGYGPVSADLLSPSPVVTASCGSGARGRGGGGRARGPTSAVVPHVLSHAATSATSEQSPLPPQMLALLQSCWGTFSAARDEALGFGCAPQPSAETLHYASTILRLKPHCAALVPVEVVGLQMVVAEESPSLSPSTMPLRVAVEIRDFRLDSGGSSLDDASPEREVITAMLSEDCRRQVMGGADVPINASTVAWCSAQLKILQRSFFPPAPAFAVSLDFSTGLMPTVQHLMLLQAPKQQHQEQQLERQPTRASGTAGSVVAASSPKSASAFESGSHELFSPSTRGRAGGAGLKSRQGIKRPYGDAGASAARSAPTASTTTSTSSGPYIPPSAAPAAPFSVAASAPASVPAAINPSFLNRRGGRAGSAAGAGRRWLDDDSAYRDEPSCKIGKMNFRSTTDDRGAEDADVDDDDASDGLAHLDRDAPAGVNPLMAYASAAPDERSAGYSGHRGNPRGERGGRDGGRGRGRGGRRERGDGDGIGAPAPRTLAAFL